MKQLEVTILGQVYVLACPEGGETLIAAAVARVDQEMTAIRSAGKVKARERIAVLAALNLAFDLADRRTRARQVGTGRHRHRRAAPARRRRPRRRRPASVNSGANPDHPWGAQAGLEWFRPL